MIIIEIKLIIIRSRITLTQRTPLPSVWRHQFLVPLPQCQTTGEDNIIIRSFVDQDCSFLSYYDHLQHVATMVIMILVITGQRLPDAVEPSRRRSFLNRMRQTRLSPENNHWPIVVIASVYIRSDPCIALSVTHPLTQSITLSLNLHKKKLTCG